MQRPANKWWSLPLCIAIEAAISVTFFNYAAYGTPHSSRPGILLGELTLVAGICVIAFGVLNTSAGRRLLLVINGLSCSSLGLILFRIRIAFSTIALLITVMAISLSAYELATVEKVRRPRTWAWLPAAFGAASVGFALVFLAFGLGWIKLDPVSPAEGFLWLGSYFGLSALCMLDSGWQPPRQAFLQSAQ